MGDNLPELLYRTFCNAGGYVYGSDESPSWHNLPSEERDAWEQVAAKAAAQYQPILDSLREVAGNLADATEHCRACRHCGEGPCCDLCNVEKYANEIREGLGR